MTRPRLASCVWLALCAPLSCSRGDETPPPLLPIPEPAGLVRMSPGVREAFRTAAEDASLAAAPGSPAARRAESFERAGLLALAYRQLDVAGAALENARRLEPGEARHAYYLGVTHELAGRLEESRAAFGEALDRKPGDVATLVRLGECEKALGRLDVAEERLGEARERDESCARAITGLGELKAARGDHRAAAALLEQALAWQPRAARPKYALARSLVALGEEARARRLLAEIAEPGLLQEEVRMDDPLMESVEALRRDPQIHERRALAASGSGRAGLAIAELRQALALDPALPEARYNLAHLLAATGRRQEALEAVAPLCVQGHPQALELAGRTLRELGHLAPAEALLVESLARDPRSVEAHLALGSLLLATGRTSEALGHHERAASLAPGTLPARLARDASLLALGRWEESCLRIEEDLAAFPGEPGPPLLLARLLSATTQASMRDPARAAELAADVAREHWTVASAEARAMAMAAAGDGREALAWIDACVEAAHGRGDEGLVLRMERRRKEIREGRPLAAWTAGDTLSELPVERPAP